MWKPWHGLAVRSNDGAVANARAAATELSRSLVERAEIDLYLASLQYRSAEPLPVAGRERPA